MSALTNKHILFIGNRSALIDELEEQLSSYGADVAHIDLAQFSAEYLGGHPTDLIILSDDCKNDVCETVLRSIRDVSSSTVIPVFVQVDDSPERIEDVLAHGAADYISPNEDARTVLSKIKAIFEQSEVFSDSAAIDISPIEASVTSTGIRVFVVEDDPLLRNLLSIRLDKSLFPYEFSRDGSNVLPLMKRFRPDVIILDLMLPGRSGFEVLAEVKADESLRNIPVIVFSNRDGYDDRTKAKELGARGYYVKAMTDLSELIETIESLVK